jgi:hypothetical protein
VSIALKIKFLCLSTSTTSSTFTWPCIWFYVCTLHSDRDNTYYYSCGPKGSVWFGMQRAMEAWHPSLPELSTSRKLFPWKFWTFSSPHHRDDSRRRS